MNETFLKLYGDSTYKDNRRCDSVIDRFAEESLMQLYYTTSVTKVIKGMIAGFFISFGCIAMITIQAYSDLSPIVNKILSGLVFSIGLFMVVNIPSHLFTGNCLLYIFYYDLDARKPIFPRYSEGWKPFVNRTKKEIPRFLLSSYLYNILGIAIVALIFYLVSPKINIDAATAIAMNKCSKGYLNLFLDGIMCNILVCTAVWFSRSRTSVTDSFIAVCIPVTIFIVCGFEHSIADVFFWIFANSAEVSIFELLMKLLTISFGNLFGGMLISYIIFKSRDYMYNGDDHVEF